MKLTREADVWIIDLGDGENRFTGTIKTMLYAPAIAALRA